MSLYRYPEVYAALLCPEPDFLDLLMEWIDTYLDGPCTSAMDPCCGPATYLLPLAVRGFRVAGNDLSPVMVAEARRRLLDEDAEITEGDMRALQFETGPFDVAVNFHGSLGHLPDLQAMAQHLASMRDALRPGGLYFLGICVFDGDATDDTLWTLYESDVRPIPSGGMAAVRYESVRRDPVAREETIVLHLLTKGVADCPPQIEERYVLRTLREADVRALLAEVGGLDLLAVHAMTEDEHPDQGLYPNCGDVTLVLRRRGT